MTSPARGDDRGGLARGTARSLVAGVFLVVDLAVIALWTSVLSTSPQLRSLVVASVVTLAVGMCCLVAVIILGVRWRHPVAATRPNRNTATSALSALSVLQLVGGFTAMTVLGAFSTPNGFQLLLATMIPSVAVLLLALGVARHVSRTSAGVPG